MHRKMGGAGKEHPCRLCRSLYDVGSSRLTAPAPPMTDSRLRFPPELYMFPDPSTHSLILNTQRGSNAYLHTSQWTASSPSPLSSSRCTVIDSRDRVGGERSTRATRVPARAFARREAVRSSYQSDNVFPIEDTTGETSSGNTMILTAVVVAVGILPDRACSKVVFRVGMLYAMAPCSTVYVFKLSLHS